MNVLENISDLLYRYNCVIIPDFGALLTQRIPATIGSNEQVFFPPKKSISFNQQITNNDGLLANYISKKENITYAQACANITEFVQDTIKKLEIGNHVSLLEIGSFTLNDENNIIFQAKHTVNYLTEAFGLSTLALENIERTTQSFKDIEAEKVVSLNDVDKTSWITPTVKYAAVGIMLLSVGGIGLKINKNAVLSHNAKQIVAAENKIVQHLQSASFSVDIPEALPGITIEIPSKKKDEKAVVTPEKKDNYFVVAGAFRAYTNATKKMNQLAKKGFKPKYIGQNKYGLHQIAYASFNNERDATNALNKLKKTENQSAWLLAIK